MGNITPIKADLVSEDWHIGVIDTMAGVKGGAVGFGQSSPNAHRL